MSPPRAMLAFLFILFATIASTFQYDTKAQDELSSVSTTNDLIDPGSDIIIHSLPDAMRTARKTLADLETKPSCHNVAAAALIHSCSTLDGSVTPSNDDISRGADFIVQEEIDIYAARLAVCELNSAKAPVPHACRAFVPTIRTAKQRSWGGWVTGNGPTKPRPLYPVYDEITKEHLTQCLSALHSSGQAWTSFTSSKTNAAILCHTMRGEIERDHTIHLHKVLATTTEEVVDALLRSKQDWQEFLAGFTELASNSRTLHLNLVQDDEQRLERARRTWAEWEANLQQDLQHISTIVHDIQSDVDQARDNVNANNQHVDEAFQQMSGHFSELAVQHGKEVRDISDETVAALDLLQYFAEVFQQGVIQGAYNATQSLQLANTMISNFSDALANMTGRLGKLEETADKVDKLHTDVESLSDVFNGNWMGAVNLIQTGVAFVSYSVVFSLLSVGIWQRLMPFPGNVCASLASGLVLAYVGTFHFGPHQALRFVVSLLPSAEGMTANTSLPTVYMCVAAIAIVTICSVHRLLAGRWLPCLRRQQTHGDFGTDMPVKCATGFRLPVNDPKHFAGMADKQVMREAGGIKRWVV